MTLGYQGVVWAARMVQAAVVLLGVVRRGIGGVGGIEVGREGGTGSGGGVVGGIIWVGMGVCGVGALSLICCWNLGTTNCVLWYLVVLS